MKRRRGALWVLACLPALFGTTTPASAVPLLVSESLIGTVVPGSPAGDAVHTDRLNFFITWYNGGTKPTQPDKKTYTLDPGTALPLLLPFPAVLDPADRIEDPPGRTITVATPYNYLAAKFGNRTAYYYLGGLTGEVTLESPFSGGGLSHVALFNEHERVVPEPGTMLLLGAGLLGLATVRRRRS